MSDITKCKGTDCPIKDGCYRYTSQAGMMQSYFVDIPGKLKDNKFSCEMYWGKQAQNIYEELNHIVKGKKK